MTDCKAILASMLVLTAAPVAAAQASSANTEPMSNPPRTLDGYPDIQGNWTNESATRLERSAQTDKLKLTPEEARQLESEFIWNVVAKEQESERVDISDLPPAGDQAELGTRGYSAFWLETGEHFAMVKGEYRSSWITEPANGQIPRKPGAAGRRGSFDGPETRSAGERCLAHAKNGPVMQNGFYNNNYQIVQTRDYVMILPEMMREPRIIPIVSGPENAEHLPDAITPWFGDAVGWYEGQTLVVETVNVNPRQGSLLSPGGRMIERFSRWSDDQILYEFKIDDPQLYTQVWKGEMSLDRFDEPMFEFACHEGNYALPGILGGARYQERNAGDQK